MTNTTPVAAPELLYEPSFCAIALEEAGLPATPDPTGVKYTSEEKRIVSRRITSGRPHVLFAIRQARRDASIQAVAERRAA